MISSGTDKEDKPQFLPTATTRRRRVLRGYRVHRGAVGVHTPAAHARTRRSTRRVFLAGRRGRPRVATSPDTPRADSDPAAVASREQRGRRRPPGQRREASSPPARSDAASGPNAARSRSRATAGALWCLRRGAWWLGPVAGDGAGNPPWYERAAERLSSSRLWLEDEFFDRELRSYLR